jgi:chromosome segregation and condensation protein ScpB
MAKQGEFTRVQVMAMVGAESSADNLLRDFVSMGLIKKVGRVSACGSPMLYEWIGIEGDPNR